MHKKPFYNSKTKETYRYAILGGAKVKILTGSVYLASRSGDYTVWTNELGEEVKREMRVDYVKTY